MANENEISNEVKIAQGGTVTFANDVLATIASFAAADIDGVDGTSGNVVEGLTGILSTKKNLTKGIKIEVADNEVAVDISIIIKYGYKLHEVCTNVQESIKNAIETMTGLKVIQVNVTVQSVSLEKANKKAEVAVDPQ